MADEDWSKRVFVLRIFPLSWGGDAVRGEKKIVFQKARIQTAQRANTHVYVMRCVSIHKRTDVYVPR